VPGGRGVDGVTASISTETLKPFNVTTFNTVDGAGMFAVYYCHLLEAE
jgi:hypothetical protein